MTRVRTLTLLVLFIAGTTACEETLSVPSAPTQPPLVSQATTQVFTGTLSPGGTQSVAINVGSVPIRVSLSSLTDSAGTPLPQSLRLTFGVPQGTGCGALHTTTTPANLSTHLQMLVTGGTFCIGVADIGQLSGDATYAIRVTLGDPTTRGETTTVEYSSTVLPNGSTTRTFNAHARGEVTVLMDTISPASVASLKLGIGFPRNDGGGCQINLSATATRGAQFTVPVEAGTYCVQVSDPGTLSGPAQFTLRIQHP